MKSKIPKVLHLAAGRPLLGHVLEAVRPLRVESIGVVIGHLSEQVAEFLGSLGFRTSVFRQRPLLGSGDAVKRAAPWLRRRRGDVLVLCGDSPLLRTETLRTFVSAHRESGRAGTVLTAEMPDPTGYGRIKRLSDGSVDRIVEERDASPDVRSIREINTGVYCFDARALATALPKLRADNVKSEYYLTDVVQILHESGASVGAHVCRNSEEALGVNRRKDLAQVETVLRRRTVSRWMDEGVTFVDPEQSYIGAGVKIGPDTVVYPGTHLVGHVIVGAGCRIGPFAYLEDCTLGDGVEFIASFARGARVSSNVRVGPFSHLREGTVIESGAHIGNFSEIKKSRVGRNAKVNHLSYIGDASLGERVNIGAGTITCNYDGRRKSRTVIGSGSFIGSNVNLVAPVNIGKGAVVGAGSTVTRSVPAGALALERSSQIVKKGWVKKRLAQEKKRENHR
jgi:bifunctional UDP-N-acetylglucosamine pyrophosphorylase/glucosamine-1-phosphate N-acetyltransferase